MRRLYFAIVTIFVIAVILFVGTFFYLDRSKHRVFYFVMKMDKHEVGMFKVDKFETEDKTIIKSYSDIPFFYGLNESKEKAEYNRRHELEDFTREGYGNGGASLYCLERKRASVSFLTKYNSVFLYLDDIPIKRNMLFFNERSPASYIPLIDNYDFKKGGAQVFNIFMNLSDELPPIKKMALLTPIKDEYIINEGKRIRTENISIRVKNLLNAAVWVSKSDKTVIKIEIPDKNVTIERCRTSKLFNAKGYSAEDPSYESRDVVINNKNIELAGVFTVPKKNGKLPAVLLIPGEGPKDRDYEGLFSSIADYLAKNGYCVLRYDKRGIGQSSGDYGSTSLGEETNDVAAAIDFLAGQKETDPQKIALVSHSTGAYFALKLSAEKDGIVTIVLMAPDLPYIEGKDMRLENIKRLSAQQFWSEEYLNLVIKAINDSRDRATKSGHSWTLIMGRLCYAKKLKEIASEKSDDSVKRVKVPTLIIQASGASPAGDEAGTMLDKLLAGNSNPNHALKYFSYADPMFGKIVDDGIHIIHYSTDKDVMESINWWLGGTMPSLQKSIDTSSGAITVVKKN